MDLRNGCACYASKKPVADQARQTGRAAHYTHTGQFEYGALRPSSDTLKRLADALDFSSDCLLEGSTDEAAKARFEDRELLRQFQGVEHLPEDGRGQDGDQGSAGCPSDQETPANPGTLR